MIKIFFNLESLEWITTSLFLFENEKRSEFVIIFNKLLVLEEFFVDKSFIIVKWRKEECSVRFLTMRIIKEDKSWAHGNDFPETVLTNCLFPKCLGSKATRSASKIKELLAILTLYFKYCFTHLNLDNAYSNFPFVYLFNDEGWQFRNSIVIRQWSKTVFSFGLSKTVLWDV